MKAFLAEAMALTGDLDGALHLLDDAIAQIERPRGFALGISLTFQ
jgi:hypothetical protein